MNDKITSTENADPTPDEPSSPNGLESGAEETNKNGNFSTVMRELVRGFRRISGNGGSARDTLDE